MILPPPEPCICEPTDPVIDPVVIPNLPCDPLPPPPTYNTPTQQTNKFHLSFQWACRKNVPFASCQGVVVWNDVIILSVNPSDYAIHTENLVVYVQQGQNKLQFEGAGQSNSYGLTIDNVILKRDGTLVNIVVNGGFEQPNQYGSWGIYNDIPGWKGYNI